MQSPFETDTLKADPMGASVPPPGSCLMSLAWIRDRPRPAFAPQASPPKRS